MRDLKSYVYFLKHKGRQWPSGCVCFPESINVFFCFWYTCNYGIVPIE